MINSLKILTLLKTSEIKKKFPGVPDYAIPKTKYSDKTANDLTKAIVDFINLSRTGQAERINSSGRRWKIRGRERWIPTAGQKGTADISATKLIEIDGRRIGIKVAIEVKMGKDRQSEAQRQYQHQIEQAGGVYLIATSFEQFIEAWNKI